MWKKKQKRICKFERKRNKELLQRKINIKKYVKKLAKSGICTKAFLPKERTSKYTR